jgi:hypothetical protein
MNTEEILSDNELHNNITELTITSSQYQQYKNLDNELFDIEKDFYKTKKYEFKYNDKNKGDYVSNGYNKSVIRLDHIFNEDKNIALMAFNNIKINTNNIKNIKEVKIYYTSHNNSIMVNYPYITGNGNIFNSPDEFFFIHKYYDTNISIIYKCDFSLSVDFYKNLRNKYQDKIDELNYKHNRQITLFNPKYVDDYNYITSKIMLNYFKRYLMIKSGTHDYTLYCDGMCKKFTIYLDDEYINENKSILNQIYNNFIKNNTDEQIKDCEFDLMLKFNNCNYLTKKITLNKDTPYIDIVFPFPINFSRIQDINLSITSNKDCKIHLKFDIYNSIFVFQNKKDDAQSFYYGYDYNYDFKY